MNNKNLFLKRWKKALFLAKVLSWIPFLKMIGLNGSLVTRKNFSPRSDIDFLIITQKNRVYTVRFLVSAFLFLIGQKRFSRFTAGKACIPRYLDENSLEIKPHDFYHAFVFSSLVPLYDESNLYSEYQKANFWMKKEFGFEVGPSFLVPKEISLPIKKGKMAGKIKDFLEKILTNKLGDLIESFLFSLQRWEIALKQKKERKKGIIRVVEKSGSYFYLSDYSFLAQIKGSGYLDKLKKSVNNK